MLMLALFSETVYVQSSFDDIDQIFASLSLPFPSVDHFYPPHPPISPILSILFLCTYAHYQIICRLARLPVIYIISSGQLGKKRGWGISLF